MNRQQKEVQQQFLDNEKAILASLKETYQDAIDEINDKIAILMARQDADMQHVIYQVEYQKALKSQIQGILDNMQANEFESISEYLTTAYEDGFIGAMYDMQAQGVPLVMPIDQEQVVAAIQHETKLSENLYTALGKDVKDLQKKISGEISRGIAGGQMFSEIARNISGYAGISRNNAIRIARTEGHRIQCKAASDAQWKAKAKGADVVKQWDSALDAKTRPHHRELDGQIRELDEPFEIAGMKAMFPSDFGRASEDINCRCALLQRARWALEEDIQVTKWSEDAPVMISDDGTTQFVDLSDAKNYKQFKERYKQLIEMENFSEYTESERIAKAMKYAIDNKVIGGRKYMDKFANMAEDSEVRKEFYDNAREILKHRSGQNGEDLYLYNQKTKKWYKSTSGKEAGTPEYNKEITDAIRKSSKGELISFHNHPASMPPSADDINSAMKNGYAKGYALCHDGKIYEYTASDRLIDMGIYDMHIAKYQKKGYNEFEAQLETMQYLSRVYGFEFKEV